VAWDSSVGTVTGYRLDGPEITSRWGRVFFALRLTGLRAHPVFYTMRTGSFPEIRELGRGVNHPPHLSPRLKKE